MTFAPLWAISRMTRSESAPSGTFSTNWVVTLPLRAASSCLRPRSCWKVQPASPTGPT